MHITAAVRQLAAQAGGAAWLEQLPSLVAEVAAAWDLDVDVDQPFEGSSVSWAAPARRGSDDVVLKVQWPHPECEHEAAALAAWAGEGAVRRWLLADGR